MFGRKTTHAASEPTVLGRGAVVEGTIRACGPIQIDGQVDGTLLVDGAVSVGPNGSVTGELVADEIAVGGRVEGKLTARSHLHIAPGGSVRGEVRYGSLQVDRGGVLDGTTGQGLGAAETAPSATATRPSKPPPPPLGPAVRNSNVAVS